MQVTLPGSRPAKFVEIIGIITGIHALVVDIGVIPQLNIIWFLISIDTIDKRKLAKLIDTGQNI
jgi:hypothetical protein